MKKLAICFAGQGSQYQGMALDYMTSNPTYEALASKASSLLGYDVKNILTSEHGEINDTLYTQPMILLHSILAYEAFLQLNVQVDATLGFSLGEYSALYASGIFSFEEIIKLIDLRSKHMKDCAIKNPGKMAAILGLSSDAVDQVCAQASDSNQLVVSANYNSPIQTVISGDEHAVLKAIELAKEKGAKRAMMLNVSGAFHSPLMTEAKINFLKDLENYQGNTLKFPIYMNKTAKPLNALELHDLMADQIVSPVLFEPSIRHMIEDGITHFVEIGPGRVLSGLIQKIDPHVSVTNLDRFSDLDDLKGWLESHGFKK